MIPDKVLEQHIAILGKTGSGKTYTAKGIAETILRHGGRLCVLDPTSVWWGLRSDHAGKKAAFPIVVFGGEHGDCPLGQQHGAAIAEIIGTSDTSAVLDTRLMTVGERTRFFTDFAETLLRKNRGPLHLIIDEAHLFAPQGRVNDPQSGKMLHAANNLVSLGRGVGLRVILISQRPAKLHKDSLTQAETLIAMRLIAPQDRNAVEDWIGEWADPKQGKELMASLPSLHTGEGWLWSPEQGILEREKFPKITTYDSSRAPDGTSSKIVLASIDLPTIQTRLEAVAHDAFANDPARLRKRISELEASLKISRPGHPDPDALKREFDRGADSVKKILWKELSEYRQSLVKVLSAYMKSFDSAFQVLNQASERVAAIDIPTFTGIEEAIQQAKSTAIPAPSSAPPRTSPPRTQPSGNSNGTVSGLRRNILTTLAQHGGCSNMQKLATLAGTTVSGYFKNELGGLRTSGYITPARVLPVEITDAGAEALGSWDPLPTGQALQTWWLNNLGGGIQAKMLSAMIARRGRSTSMDELAEDCGTVVSGHFKNELGSLRTKGLISPARTPLAVSEDLFED